MHGMIRLLSAKLKSWKRSDKGYTCTQSPLADFVRKVYVLKKDLGSWPDQKGRIQY